MSGKPVLTIIVMPPPPSLNKMLRLHWHKRNGLFRDIYWQVHAGLHRRSDGPDCWRLREPFAGRVVITAERFSRGKLDPDNLIGSLKPVIDGLRHCGVIEDDTAQHVRLGEIEQVYTTGAPYLVVNVSPDDEDGRERKLVRDFLVPLLEAE